MGKQPLLKLKSVNQVQDVYAVASSPDGRTPRSSRGGCPAPPLCGQGRRLCIFIVDQVLGILQTVSLLHTYISLSLYIDAHTYIYIFHVYVYRERVREKGIYSAYIHIVSYRPCQQVLSSQPINASVCSSVCRSVRGPAPRYPTLSTGCVLERWYLHNSYYID